MADPVARIQSIVHAGTYPQAYRYANGQFHYIAPGLVQSFGDSVSVPGVVIRAGDKTGRFAVATVNLPLCIGDIIKTSPGVLMAIEFLIGGRVGLNRDTAVKIVNERSVADGEMSWKRILLKNAALWVKADAKTLKQPIEIQTSGGVMGIKG